MPEKKSRKAMGNQGEEAAARYLQARGFAVLARQWRCRYGELDLIARSPDGVVCFVEVKLRSANSIAPPRAFVDRRKRDKLRLSASLWLSARNPDAPARFDVAEVYALPDGSLQVEYLENAFE